MFLSNRYVVRVLLILCFPIGSFAEKTTVLSIQQKMNELCLPFRNAGFIMYKKGDLNMERRTEFPIIVELKEGRWYQFCIVGDPKATKIEFKMATAEDGNIVTDKFNVEKTGEYWTGYSFICPRSGKYLLTFYQRSSYKNLNGQIAILQKPSSTATSSIHYKH
ncbi:MAG: hypothetical protein JNM95_11850 [Chitinophagaceae bacterium]|nr:hypothetical protein [Chitinophagaceae bacterium]